MFDNEIENLLNEFNIKDAEIDNFDANEDFAIDDLDTFDMEW